MAEVHGYKPPVPISAPMISEDLKKQAEFPEIKTEAGKVAYKKVVKERDGKARVRQGIYDARGALNYVKSALDKDDQENEK